MSHLSSTVEQVLAALTVANEAATPRARDNLRRDLEAVLARLLAGEYESTDFLARNTFDVPRRTREFFDYMTSYQQLAEQMVELLEPLPIDGVAQIINLCPGWTPKVELALARLGYAGKVVLVDKDAATATALCRFMRIFSPAYSFEVCQADIFAPLAACHGPVVVANHIIDDALMDYCAGPLGIESARLYEDEAELRRAWVRLVAMADALEREFPPVMARALAGFVDEEGWLVLTHYHSFVGRLLGSEAPERLFERLFNQTVNLLLAGTFVQAGPSASANAPSGRVVLRRRRG